MENKGLNVFNTAYVLADKETATDTDFERVEGVVRITTHFFCQSILPTFLNHVCSVIIPIDWPRVLSQLDRKSCDLP